MNIFYAPEISGDFCYLDENESGHCIRVLRMSAGSVLKVTDGAGHLYEGLVVDPDPAKCKIRIIAPIDSDEERHYRLHIAISPLKNHDRFEWFLEKCVEIGIDEITPVICRNTEKPGVKVLRLNSIIIAAMKQSLKTIKPVLNDPVSFEEFLRRDLRGVKMIAHCHKDQEKSAVDKVCQRGEPATILIGPEGDFSEEETALALVKGFLPVHLGKSRLRTETAGIAACLSVYLINQ